MALTFRQIKDEVKARSIRNQGGTVFDTEVANTINTSLYRVAREAPWRSLRRKTNFITTAQQVTGTVTATNGSNSFTGSSLDLITNGVNVGRRFTLQGSSKIYTISTITGENAFTSLSTQTYDGTTASGLTWTLYGTEEYNLPIQCGRIGVMWHEAFGYPFTLEYITDYDFYNTNVQINTANIPTHYRMWGEDNILRQPIEGSVMRVYSSDSTDTAKAITIFGTVAGYPDYEIISTNGSNGTTAASGSKVFTSVERIAKNATTVGRITVDSNSGNVIVGVLPTSMVNNAVQYKKIQVFPLPTTSFPVTVQYYKDPGYLVNDGDIHELGVDFDEAVILLTVAKLKYSQDQDTADKFFSMYKDEVATLRRVNMDRNLDWIPRLLRPRSSRSNHGTVFKGISYQQLGGSYGPITFGR